MVLRWYVVQLCALAPPCRHCTLTPRCSEASESGSLAGRLSGTGGAEIRETTLLVQIAATAFPWYPVT